MSIMTRRVWNVAEKSKCTMRIKVTGWLARENLGKDPYDTGAAPAVYAESSDGSVTFKSGKSSLRMKSFAGNVLWYPGIELDAESGGAKFSLCFEDMKLKAAAEPLAEGVGGPPAAGAGGPQRSPEARRDPDDRP